MAVMPVRTRVIAGVLSVLIVGGLLGAYFYQRATGPAAFKPQGTLLLSLAPLGSSIVDLYEYDIVTGGLRRVAQDGNSNFSARLSPDGSRLAYVSSQGGNQLYTFDQGSGERNPLVKDAIPIKRMLDWNPRGKSVAYAGNRSEEHTSELQSPD